jgi:hypothetical protein
MRLVKSASIKIRVTRGMKREMEKLAPTKHTDASGIARDAIFNFLVAAGVSVEEINSDAKNPQEPRTDKGYKIPQIVKSGKL